MTRVLYGLSGEGSGHSSRSREMANHLIASGHEVKLVSYDRGYRNLKDDFDVLEIEGLSISSEDNRVSKFKTIVDNLKKLPAGGRSLHGLRDCFPSFQPHVVICDFEPMTAYLAEHYEVPLISLDNQHRMRYVEHETPFGLDAERRMTRNIIRLMVPWPSVSLVTALVSGPTTNQRTFVFPPIVRKSVRDRQPTDAGHVLVYLTSGFDSLLPNLKQFHREKFVVYGYDRDELDGNLQFKKASKDGFLDDLASSKAVIATAGFTLISEAIYLRKPYLAFPMTGQYEQQLNAFQLQENGIGRCGHEATEEVVGNFFYGLPDFASRLRQWPTDDGSLIKAKLDELVNNEAALAVEYKNNRRANSNK